MNIVQWLVQGSSYTRRMQFKQIQAITKCIEMETLAWEKTQNWTNQIQQASTEIGTKIDLYGH